MGSLFEYDPCVKSLSVATLALGSQPKEGLAKMRAKSEALQITFHVFENVGECEGMNPHILKSLEGDCRGQNSLESSWNRDV
jgi:hypothetical protein